MCIFGQHSRLPSEGDQLKARSASHCAHFARIEPACPISKRVDDVPDGGGLTMAGRPVRRMVLILTVSHPVYLQPWSVASLSVSYDIDLIIPQSP